MKLETIKSSKEKHIQYYDYCDSNLTSLVNDLDLELRNSPPKDFTSFDNKLNGLIDKTCKLDKPKVSKRNAINNPWITPGLIAASNKKHKLHSEWIRTCSKRNVGGDANLHKQWLDYRRSLTYIIKDARSSYYVKKITEKLGNRKKTWELLN